VYFKKGGQEIQINSVSRDILIDAMEHPEQYEDLVVRVSGFSAYYTTLDRKIQVDILERTEHE
jgi:formate C-acetyltransferase